MNRDHGRDSGDQEREDQRWLDRERDYFADPSPRILAAESRRHARDLIDRSSLGTPGAKALAKYGRGERLTPQEAEAMAQELRQLEEELARLSPCRRRPRDHTTDTAREG